MASIKPLIHSDESDVITKIGKDLYLSEEMADFHFKFEVDDGQYERVPAHKVFLITASDVFRAMFNGTWEENKEVEIVDASVVEFKEFFQFFYLQHVKVSMENVARVMYLGNKYNIAKCMSVCEKFIINTVDENNICWAYELAIIYNQTNLKTYCETLIGIDTSAVLASESFLKCNSKILGHILNLDSLSCPENELFEACMNWVRANAKVDQLTREIVRAQLGKSFYSIRFKSMTPQEFAALLPVYGEIFSVREYIDISQAVAVQNFQSSIFKDNPRTPNECLQSKKENSLCCDRKISMYFSAEPHYIRNVETTTFSINTPLFLKAITLASIYEYKNFSYYSIKFLPTEVTIVQLPDSARSGNEIPIHNETNKIQNGSCTSITLPKPVLIRPGVKYEIRLKQTPTNNCSCGIMLKSDVEMGSNITVQFHGDAVVLEKDKVNSKKVTRGIVEEIHFIRPFNNT